MTVLKRLTVLTVSALLTAPAGAVSQPGPVDVGQDYVFTEGTTVTFELIEWPGSACDLKPDRTKSYGCIWPAVDGNRHIMIVKRGRRAMLESARHECEHLAYGPDHVIWSLKRTLRGGWRWKGQIPRLNPDDPQKYIKNNAYRSCYAKAERFIMNASPSW